MFKDLTIQRGDTTLYELHNQKIVEIGGVTVGGVPGQNPTVLIGSIFYHGHKIVEDNKQGRFNRTQAEAAIYLQEEFSDKTGNPHMVDIIGTTSQAIQTFIEFVANATDAPILIDAPTPTVRVAGLQYAKETGLINRVVINSLTIPLGEEELRTIQEVGLRSAVLLALNTREFTTKGRIDVAKELVRVAQTNGIDKPLLDTCVLDIPSLGMAWRALFLLKRELGLPVGCGAHNAINTWKGLHTKMGKQAVNPSIASVNAITAALGADYVLYGPIEDASYVFPVVAMTDAAFAHLLMESGSRIDKTHPLFKIA